MARLNPWIFGVVVSLTAAIAYVLCTLFWFAFTESSLDFLSTLFHGMDFRKIYADTSFALANYLGVLVVFLVWGYVMGAIYATLRNLLIARGN